MRKWILTAWAVFMPAFLWAQEEAVLRAALFLSGAGSEEEADEEWVRRLESAGKVKINSGRLRPGILSDAQIASIGRYRASYGDILSWEELALVDGFSVFANALGGKALGYRVPTHYANHRYDSPLLMYGSIYTPLDAEAGIKIGPFQGLSAKASIGYAIVKDQPGIWYYANHPDGVPQLALGTGLMSTYTVIDGRGYYLNAEVEYKYRSLIEASAGIKYAPHDNQFYATDKHYNNYKLGVDRASTVGNIDIKVTPWRPLSVNVGLEYRGGRMALFGNQTSLVIDENAYMIQQSTPYQFVDMDDVVNLHAGATYRLNSNLGLWLQAHNLLNRRYDILFGHGAQRIGFMVGASLTF